MKVQIMMPVFLLCAAALGSLLVGGVFFAFSTFVMKALGQLPPSQGAAAMNAINVTVINPLFIGTFMGTTLLSLLLIAYSALNIGKPGTVWIFAASLTYLAGSFGVTMFCNVPLNGALVRAVASDLNHVWADYLVRWTGWNHARTIASLAAGALFLRATALQLQI